MDRHTAKGILAGLPLALIVAWLSDDWPLGVTFLAIAAGGTFSGLVMMRSLDAAERRERQRGADSSPSSSGG